MMLTRDCRKPQGLLCEEGAEGKAPAGSFLKVTSCGGGGAGGSPAAVEEAAAEAKVVKAQLEEQKVSRAGRRVPPTRALAGD